MRQADIDDGIKDGLTTAEQAEVVRLRRENRRLEMENEILRRAAAYFAKEPSQNEVPAGPRPGRRGVPGAADLRGARLHPQAFYKWQAARLPTVTSTTPTSINAIVDVHDDDPEFGYRFISDELERAGHEVGERRVWRLCSRAPDLVDDHEEGPAAHGKRPGPAVHDDLVQRDFTAPAPDKVWLTDITEHPTGQGKLYVCCDQGRLLEPDRRLLHLADRMTAALATTALRSAVARRQPQGHRGGSFGQGRPAVRDL